MTLNLGQYQIKLSKKEGNETNSEIDQIQQAIITK